MRRQGITAIRWTRRLMTVLRQVCGSIALIAVVCAARVAGQTAAAPDPARFEKNVVAYEAIDKASVPPKGAILLAGDSQFYRWKTLAEDLPEYTIINRGVDSFQTPDLLHYTDRLVLPYRPRLIILH